METFLPTCASSFFIKMWPAYTFDFETPALEDVSTHTHPSNAYHHATFSRSITSRAHETSHMAKCELSQIVNDNEMFSKLVG